MQEFWATAKLHQHSIQIKMDTRKHVLDLEAFREMLHISLRIMGQYFAEFPFEGEILKCLRFLGHSTQIKTLTDVNINKLYQPWRSFAAVINKSLTGKSSGNDSLRKPSIPRRNRVNWHYVRDDVLFSTIKVVSRQQTTQQYGAILPIELTTEDIRNSKAYMEYYACATGEVAPKPKASARKKKGGSASSTTPPTPIANPTPTTAVVAAPRLSAAAKDEGTGSKRRVPDVPSDDSEEELSWNSFDDEDVDEQTKGRDKSEGDKTDESNDDDDDQDEAEKGNDDDDDEEEISKIGEQKATESDEGDDEATESDRESLRIHEEERIQEEEEADELYRDVNINQGRGLQVSQETTDSHVFLTPTQSDAQQESSSTLSFMTSLLNPLIDIGMESIFTTGSTTVTPIPSHQSTMTPSIISTFTTASQLPTPPPQIPSLDLQSLPTFASVFRFEDRVKFLEDNFSNIPGSVNQYMHQQMPEAVREKIIKEKVKTQVKAQVTRILPRIEESVNTQLEAEVLTRSSHSSRTSYAVAADLSEMELKKILIDKMEGNKSIQREDDDQEGPSAGSDRGSKRQREGGEHASASTPSEPATGSVGRSTTGSQSRQLSASAENQPIIQTTQHPEWFSQPRRPPTPDRDWNKTLPVAQGNVQSWISAQAKQTDARSSFHGLLDTPIDFSNFIMNRLGEVYKATTDQLDWVNPKGQQYPHNLLQPLPLIPDNRVRRVIPFEHFINNDLEYLRG
nr:hypothetical protein [Tanacetum cinerariifolium]